jgi:hypothetical protein
MGARAVVAKKLSPSPSSVQSQASLRSANDVYTIASLISISDPLSPNNTKFKAPSVPVLQTKSKNVPLHTQNCLGYGYSIKSGRLDFVRHPVIWDC